MKISVPKEMFPGEHRVAAVPETVSKMVKAGFEVCVESNAGIDAYFEDSHYVESGARIEPKTKNLFSEADILIKVQRPLFEKKLDEIKLIKNNTILIGNLMPLAFPETIIKLNEKKLTVFSLDCLPRIARAQSMDILSSMSNIAGYKSVLLAANRLGKFFPLLMTAAGTIPPAKVLVIGAGVAGLQAIATARRLGAVVTAFDTRPIAEEQVKSLGAEFVSLEVSHEHAEDTGGYAKALSADFYQKEQEIINQYSKDADVIITTALIPGKPAPLLITDKMVQAMKKGSVIVDLSAEQGGNCALTQPGTEVNVHGVNIIGFTNMPSLLPIHASLLYAKNMWSFLNYLIPDGSELKLDLSDEIIKNCLITHQGEVVHPLVKQAIASTEGKK